VLPNYKEATMAGQLSTHNYIQGVFTNDLPSGRKIYKIKTVDGEEYATFKPEIAEKARQYEGHEAQILYVVVEKNGYTNLYLNDVIDPEPSVKPQAEIPFEASDKDVQIARAVAMKAAVEYLSVPEQERESVKTLLELVDVLADSLLRK
jgi:hypothetical protein